MYCESRPISTVIIWPSAPLTEALVRKSLEDLTPFKVTLLLPKSVLPGPTLQWSAYDHIDHERTHLNRDAVLSSSYTIRKALIRKHFLSRCIQAYITKRDSCLKNAVPKTWDLQLSFADELDEMLMDELWELAEELERSDRWWILKPGMADRGMGIRLFNSKDGLRQIFEEFEGDSDDEDATTEISATTVVTSQLRHFVIQEYLSTPLLLDPAQVPIEGRIRPLVCKGYKFHLRAYCVASGALTLYLYTRILALFSSVPYSTPVTGDGIDLTPHLTNTSLQQHRGEEGVRLLEELVGCDVFSQTEDFIGLKLTAKDVASIMDQMAQILSETFQAALENPVHFQPLPNAFELYGVDFLISHEPASTGVSPLLQVKLLEINAEPAIELTGPRLTWILEDLFLAIGKVCVAPFFHRGCGCEDVEGQWDIGQVRFGLRKCFQVTLRT